MLIDTRLQFTIAIYIGCYEESTLYFYERNRVIRGLDFAHNPDQKEDFMRYAVELLCLNPVQDITHYPLPQLEEIARGTEILLATSTHPRTYQRRDLDAALGVARTTTD